MCTKKILAALLKQAGVISYTVTNTALYILGPQVALQGAIEAFINLVAPDMESATKAKLAEGLAYGVVTPLALGLLHSTHSSYTKVVHDYHNPPSVSGSGEEKQSVGCWRTFANYGGAFLKAAASCTGWYSLFSKIPYIGGTTSAAVTTALSVPGNIYTQIAFLAQDMQPKSSNEGVNYQRLRDATGSTSTNGETSSRVAAHVV